MKKSNLYIRVSEKTKARIESRSDDLDMSISQYILFLVNMDLGLIRTRRKNANKKQS